MRRTRKWGFVAQEAKRLAGLGMTPAQIATQLNVRRSTVTRWMAAGKLTDTRANAEHRMEVSTPAPSPDGWAETVRQDYALDATDDQLVTMGEAALATALDGTQSASVRLQAMGRFQSLAKQLALVAKHADATKPVAPTTTDKPTRRLRVVRRASGDPRRTLMAVSE